MATKGTAVFPTILCLCMLACTGGCTGIGFGEVTYSGGQLEVMVDNPGEPEEATLRAPSSGRKISPREGRRTLAVVADLPGGVIIG